MGQQAAQYFTGKHFVARIAVTVQETHRDRFDAGLAPVNDLLRAASAVLDADARRVGALFDLVTGTARLNLALGRVQ